MISPVNFADLLKKWREGNINPSEAEILLNAMQLEENKELLEDTFESHLLADEFNGLVKVEGKDAGLKKLREIIVDDKQARRIPLIRTTWFKVAAAVLIVLLATAYFWLPSTQEKTIIADIPQNKTGNTTTEKVVLTLSDGRKIELDHAGTNKIIDGNLSIENDNGQLTYKNQDAGGLNTMTTPRGVQYQLVLADGTKVWLNAASSITYPVSFQTLRNDKNTRTVIVTGEAYFEVAPDAKSPFVVKSGNAAIEVLGTRFNVNAYGDQEILSASLIDGKIRVNSSTDQIILQPKEEAKIYLDNSIDKNNDIDPDEVLAWKNGLFNFNHADVRTMMNEIARWYDLDIHYNGAVPSFHYGGKISRNTTAAEMVKILSEGGLNVRLEGRKLVIN